MTSPALRSLDTFVHVEVPASTPPGPPTPDPAAQPEQSGVPWRPMIPPADPNAPTKLYLAYGSNMAAKTFQGRRSIKPLRAINVVAPDLRLTFDLPGIAYWEPCFANTAARARPAGIAAPPPPQQITQELEKAAAAASAQKIDSVSDETRALLPRRPAPNNPPDWDRGLIGVVYEVTEADFAHILATEGGGASYADIEVECFALAEGVEESPAVPAGQPFRARTLLADKKKVHRFMNRRPGWAQPTARYLGLLTAGAAENGLPKDYRRWLESLHPFHRTTVGQRVGRWVFLMAVLPAFLLMLSLRFVASDREGHLAGWATRLTESIFASAWRAYDVVFRPVFGEGERSVADIELD